MHILCEGGVHWGEKLTGEWEIDIEYLDEKNKWHSLYSMDFRLRQFSFDLEDSIHYAPDHIGATDEFDNNFYAKNLTSQVEVIESKSSNEENEKN